MCNNFNTILQKLQMQAHQLNIENDEQHKLFRIDNQLTKQSCYMQIHSQNFPFLSYDRGDKFQKQLYNITQPLNKYYYKRHFLFSKFEQGIQLDNESWYSAIPEAVSLYLKKRFSKDGFSEIFQPFSGVGGVAVHLCDEFQRYVINDIDENKLKMLATNLKVYGKQPNRLEVYCYDFLKIKPFKTQMLIIMPPWGRIDTEAYSYQDLDNLMDPKLTDIIRHGLKFSQNMLLQMPKNTNIVNFTKIIQKCGTYPVFSVEKIQTNNKTSQLFIYIGEQRFTHVRNSVFYSHLYNDLQLFQKKERNKIKKLLQEEPKKLMQSIYAAKSSKNKHIYFIQQ